jgi:hypothetical protein
MSVSIEDIFKLLEGIKSLFMIFFFKYYEQFSFDQVFKSKTPCSCIYCAILPFSLCLTKL